MSIETLTLLGPIDKCLAQITATFSKLKDHCWNVDCKVTDTQLEVCMAFPNATVWGELKSISPSDVLYSFGNGESSCLSLELGAGRCPTEIAVLYAVPAQLLMSGLSFGLVDPQFSMKTFVRVKDWDDHAIGEVAKYSETATNEVSSIYVAILRSLDRS